MFRSSKPLHLMPILTFMPLILEFFMLLMGSITLLSAHWTMFFASNIFLSKFLIALAQQFLLVKQIFICIIILWIVLVDLTIINVYFKAAFNLFDCFYCFFNKYIDVTDLIIFFQYLLNINLILIIKFYRDISKNWHVILWILFKPYSLILEFKYHI